MNERMSLDVVARAVGEESINSLTSAMERFVAASERGKTQGAGNVAKATEHAQKIHEVSQNAAASGLLMLAEGQKSVTAIENFLSKSLGMGDMLKKIFPIVGGGAFLMLLAEAGEKLVELAEKYEPIHAAEKRAKDIAKEWGGEIRKIGEEIEKINLESFTKAIGREGGSAFGGSAMAASAADDLRFASLKQSDIADKRRQLAESTAILNDPNSDYAIIVSENRKARALTAEINALTTEVSFFQTRAKKYEALASGKFLESAESRDDQTKEAIKKLEEIEKRVRGYENQAATAGMSPIEKLIQQGSVAGEGLAGANRGRIDAATRQMMSAELEKQRLSQASMPLMLQGTSTETGIVNGPGDEFMKDMERGLDRNAAALLSKLKEWNQRLKQTDEANILGIQKGAEHQARMAGMVATPGSELSALQAGLSIRQQAVEKEFQIKEAHSHLYNMDAERFKLQTEMQDAQWKFEEGVQELRLKNIQSFRENVVRGFDDIISGRGGNVLKSFAVGLERQIIGNAATMAFPIIQNATKGLHIGQGGTLGKLLAGTPFGADPLRGSATALDGAALKLSAAGDKLMTVGGGWTGEGGDFIGGVSGAAGDASGFGKWGKAIGMAGAGAAGAFGIYSGIQAGGIGGALTATGSAAGLAGAVMPMVAKSLGLVSGTASGLLAAIPVVGAIAAVALPLIGSFLGSNPQKRANEIRKQMDESTYHAPTALNATMDSSGNFVDFDARGNLRRSGFRGIPQTRDPYTTWRNGEALEAPGYETAPYRNNVTINISTIDQQGVADFTRKHSTAIADAVADQLQGAESRLSSAVRYAAGATA